MIIRKRLTVCGWIWRKNMFKTEFNSLYVASRDFILGEKRAQSFSDPSEQIKHFRSVVDEYNVLLFNLVKIQKQLDVNSSLYGEVSEVISDIGVVFNRYKDNSIIVTSYINELASLDKRITFFEKLYRFEQMFVTRPLIKVNVDEIQNVLALAREYVTNSPVFYYFTNNPYDVNADLGIIVPNKYSFDTAEKLLTSVYNYMYSLYTRYYSENKVEIDSLEILEKNIENKIYEARNYLASAKRNKITITLETTAEEYYSKIIEIENTLTSQFKMLIDDGIYRFTRLTSDFDELYKDANLFISQYKNDDLFTSFLKNKEFDEKLEKFNEYISLLEEGKVKHDIRYIIADSTLKSLAEELVELVKIVKRKITYTQKYHSSGYSTLLEFEFYQTGFFIDSVKAYYYQLMSENIYRYSNVGIDEFGDGSVDGIRKDFKTRLRNYNSFIQRDVSYLNGFEFTEYKEQVLSLQSKLKATAVNFYTQASKTAHATYIPIIEKHYSSFLNKLNADLSLLNHRNNQIYSVVVSEEKREATRRVESIGNHVKNISSILNISSKYVFLGFTDYINKTIYVKFDTLFDDLQKLFNKEDYVAVLNKYDSFFSENMINFNILYAFEKFAESVDILFMNIDKVDSMYIDEYTGIKSEPIDTSVFELLTDMFDDETYKVVRNELFSKLDMLYEFVISTRSEEKIFLTNEKNLKKMYFDNQLMKINYIRWFHKIIGAESRYKLIDRTSISTNPVFVDNQKTIEKFTYKNKISSLVENQNRSIANLSKMIYEYGVDTNFKSVNLSPDIIKNIEIFNNEITGKFDEFCSAVNILEKLVSVVEIDKKKNVLKEIHKAQWVSIIENNTIDAPEVVSYNEFEPFKGTIPYTVQLKAKMEQNVDATGKEIKATFNWYIGGVLKTGKDIKHTFYDIGKHKVRCDIVYPDGETFSRFLEFDLAGPTNSQTMKSETVEYNPTGTFKEVPKVTYLDPSGVLVTMPVKFTGSVSAAIADGGTIDFSPDGELSKDRAGLVILGFEGTTVAGDKFDVNKALGEKFEYPDAAEAEFLFDFSVSSPIGKSVSINIKNSKFAKFMAKVPPSINSVYEINKGSSYDSIGTMTRVTMGDKILLKNGFGRWIAVEILDIVDSEYDSGTSPTGKGKYDYSIKFRYFVNTSLDNVDKDAFRPTETNMVAPTLIFKSNVREVFNQLVSRLEEINGLRDKLATKIDAETRESINAKLSELDLENKKFYLFGELDKIKAKRYSLEALLADLESSLDINYASPGVDASIEKYRKHINAAKLFSDCISCVNSYDFRKNVIDLEILVHLYREQQTILEIIVDTYNYKTHDVAFYASRIKDIKLFSTDGFVDSTKDYGDMLVTLVKKLRDLLFKIKTVINFPIMTEGKYLIMSEVYYRLGLDISTGIWSKTDAVDFYLLHKKLELQYGYEIEKIESGKSYNSFISDIVSMEKELFGSGLSTNEIKDISNYIQVVESNAVAEYDDFFLIPFWIDYLEKNV